MAYVDILILQNLIARPAHGYEIKKSVERIMGGAFAVNNNVLYPALRRFEEMGAVEAEERLEILDARREYLEGLLDHLCVVRPQAEGSEHAYAAKVVEFQRSAVEHELAWISSLAEEVRRD